MDALHANLSFFIILLATALVLGILAERAHIPYTVALLLASSPFSFSNLPIQFGPATLIIFLPALIFEAAWNLDHLALRKTWRAIAVLAIPGVIFTAAVVGVGLFAMRQLPLPQALLLGAILAATDPVAIIPTFRRLTIPPNLTTLVEGESLFNDGTAVVLYGVSLAMITAGSTSSLPLWTASAVGAAIGGAAVGLVAALPIARAMRLTGDPLLHVVATIIAAYGTYLLADTLHLSGIFASIASGIGLRIFTKTTQRQVAKDEVEHFWSVLAFLTNSVLFLLIGLRIEIARMLHEPLLVLGTLTFLFLARLALVYGVLPLVRSPGEHAAWRHVVMLAGIRGALSLALALSLPSTLPMRQQIIDAVFAAVFVTLIVQGSAISPLVTRLRL